MVVEDHMQDMTRLLMVQTYSSECVTSECHARIRVGSE